MSEIIHRVVASLQALPPEVQDDIPRHLLQWVREKQAPVASDAEVRAI